MAHLELKKGSNNNKLLDGKTEPQNVRNSLGVHPLALNIASQVKHRHISSISMTTSAQQQTAVLHSSKAYGSSTDHSANYPLNQMVGSKNVTVTTQKNGGNKLVPFTDRQLKSKEQNSRMPVLDSKPYPQLSYSHQVSKTSSTINKIGADKVREDVEKDAFVVGNGPSPFMQAQKSVGGGQRREFSTAA